MFNGLKKIYDQAFPGRNFKPEEIDYVFHKIKHLGERNVRAFVKATMDAFDLLRHYPSEPINKLLEN